MGEKRDSEGPPPGPPLKEPDGALSDVWARTLSRIPTTFGRVVYLASLRDVNSGQYQHYGLSQIYSDEEADRVLAASHQQAFREWLSHSLEQQREDLEEYLGSIEGDRGALLNTWLTLTPYRNLVPTTAREAERHLYLSDLELILDLLRNELSASS